MEDRTFEDAFNLLCGRRLGRGCFRQVFECKLLPDMVVKVEDDDGMRGFHNVFEQRFWDHHSHYEPVAQWLAPCEYLSPDGRLLIQKRARPISPEDMPATLPEFLSDVKHDNFGKIDGRIVCVDYGMTNLTPKTRRVKAHWH